MKDDGVTLEIRQVLQQVRDASHRMSALTSSERNQALERFGGLIEERQESLLEANRRDCEAQKGQISHSLYQRLLLDPGKLRQLVAGIRDLCDLPDPIGRILARTMLDEGLVLDKETVPIGVIGIVFESRPDVIPQILSLILKSGNAVVLKGGREAEHSNRAFMQVVAELSTDCPWLPRSWARLLDSREAFHEMLKFPEYVDLVIPRGSNELVQTVMESTQIPVLGHTEGVCHIYVDGAADLAGALPIVIDAKVQYPAACNAVETLLVSEKIAARFLPLLGQAARAQDLRLKGCSATRVELPWIEEASEEDWRTEYGDRTLAVRVVSGLEEAIDHINRFGSHHTDAIVTADESAAEDFLKRVDSASVFVNASTRFADGYRFGLGAEVGISTNRTHARGPVGLEGLVIYKYKLRGSGQVVSDYVGSSARPFLHQVVK